MATGWLGWRWRLLLEEAAAVVVGSETWLRGEEPMSGRNLGAWNGPERRQRRRMRGRFDGRPVSIENQNQESAGNSDKKAAANLVEKPRKNPVKKLTIKSDRFPVENLVKESTVNPNKFQVKNQVKESVKNPDKISIGNPDKKFVTISCEKPMARSTEPDATEADKQ